MTSEKSKLDLLKIRRDAEGHQMSDQLSDDPQIRRFQEYILKLEVTLRQIFCLHEHKTAYHWHIYENKPSIGSGVVMMSNEIIYPYLGFQITLWEPAFKAFRDAEQGDESAALLLSKTVAHEMAHVWVEPLRWVAYEHVVPAMNETIRCYTETLCDRIALLAMYEIRRTNDWKVAKVASVSGRVPSRKTKAPARRPRGKR